MTEGFIDQHGGFPRFEVADPGPGFGRFLEGMRRLQDLAVSANPDSDTWDDAADHVEELVKLLAPFQAAEGVGPAIRVPSLPGAGSLLMPPWTVTKFSPEGVEMQVEFSRYHVGGNYAVHGGVLPLLFDQAFGMLIHAVNRPMSRTAYLHVDYRSVTPVDTDLDVIVRFDREEGRKRYLTGEIRHGERLCAEAHGLFVVLRPGSA